MNKKITYYLLTLVNIVIGLYNFYLFFQVIVILNFLSFSKQEVFFSGQFWLNFMIPQVLIISFFIFQVPFIKHYYLGKLKKDYEEFSIFEKGIYIGRSEYQKVIIDCINWTQIASFTWDLDEDNERIGITLFINDNLQKLRKREFLFELEDSNNLSSKYKLCLYLHGRDKDEISFELSKHLKEI